MSRSNYSDDYDPQQTAMWRGAVASAIQGKRGQAFLREMLSAFDALPECRLAAHVLEDGIGAVCAMGAVGAARGIDMASIDPEDSEGVAKVFGISDALMREIAYMNDEARYRETPEERFYRMKKWVEDHIR